MKLQGIVILLASLALAGCSQQAPNTSASIPAKDNSAKPAEVVATPSIAGNCLYSPGGQASKPVKLPDAEAPTSGTVTATLKFLEGDVKITMNRADAPCTINSFASLIKQKYYDHTKCHRLATDGLFMLQCGDPTATGSGGPGYTFKDELAKAKTFKPVPAAQQQPGRNVVIYPTGTVAMANAGPDTNGSQFFLVFHDSPLPPNYTAFGQMDAEGIKVIEKIAAAGSDGSYGDGTGKPYANATIEAATIS